MIGNPENGCQSAMRKVSSADMDLPAYHGSFNSDLIRDATVFKPDIIFLQLQSDGIITIDTARKLSQLGFVINFSGDVRQELPDWYLQIGKEIQLSTFSNMVDVDRCIANGVNADYLEIGIDPLIYKRRNVYKQGPSIVAHFNHYEGMFPLTDYRMEIVNRLRETFGSDFGVYGNFPNANGNFNSDQDAESRNYNYAKIAINCSHFNFNRYASDRMLRIMGSGCFCLSHTYTGIEIDYNIGEHVDVFNDIDELVAKCK